MKKSGADCPMGGKKSKMVHRPMMPPAALNVDPMAPAKAKKPYKKSK